MIKVADKPSMDPVQQKLRLLKKQWNKDVSAFIDNLIHYKKLTNGQPNKFFKERSSIKDPIPADPATIIGSLAGDFQELSQRANSIISTQMDYSKTRRKKQPKPIAAPPVAGIAPVEVPNTPPANDLSKQLAAFEQKYELVAEGSNPITRFFTRLLTPTFGTSEAARIRKYRMTLLDSCVKTFKDLEKLQVEIVRSSPASIESANKMLHKVWNDWMMVYRGFSTYKSNMPPVVADTGGEIPPSAEVTEEREKKKTQPPPAPAPTAEEAQPVPPVAAPVNEEAMITNLMNKAKEVVSDYTKNYRKLDSSAMGGYDAMLETAITKFLKSPGQYKPVAAQRVIEEHAHLMNSLNQALGTSGNSMGDVVKALALKNKPLATSAGLEAVAQDFLKKWFGKTRHQLSVFDKTSPLRLDMYKMAEEARDSIDKIMDSLEKDMKVDDIDPMIKQVNSQMIAMRGLMRAMHNMSPPKAKAPGKAQNPDDMSWGQRMDAMERYM